MLTIEALFGDDATVLRETDFQLLLLATVFPILGTGLVSPVLDSVIGPFGTTAADVGLMVSFLTAPGIVLIPVAGVLADRYGRKPVLVVGLLLFGIAGTAIGFTTDFRVVLALRFVQGVGFSGLVPTITTSIGDMYADAREATAQGLRLGMNGISGAVVPPIAGLLVVVSWRYPFALYASAVPVAIAVQLWLTETTAETDPAAARGRNEGREENGTGGEDEGNDERGKGEGTGTADDGGAAYRRALLGLLGRRRVLALVIARTLPVVVWVGFFTYNSIVVVDLLGGTPPQAGLLVAVGNLVFGIAASQAGRITARADSRFYPLVAANVALATGFAVMLFAPGLAVAAAGITVAGVGMGISLSLYRSIITGIAPQSLRGGLVSVSGAGGRVTATVTPVAMGAVIGAAAPEVGFASAVRLAGLGAAAVGGGGGVVCLLVASAAPPVPDDLPVAPGD
ncbi:MAG: MFS transporter [Haloarculaceae archaeon]